MENKEHNNIKNATAILLLSIANADNIIVIDKGKIIESGKHEMLLNNKNVYSDLWNVQVGI